MKATEQNEGWPRVTNTGQVPHDERLDSVIGKNWGGIRWQRQCAASVCSSGGCTPMWSLRMSHAGRGVRGGFLHAHVSIICRSWWHRLRHI